MIPGLERAEFARLGGVHRNTFINSPRLLDPQLRLPAAHPLRRPDHRGRGLCRERGDRPPRGRFAAAEVTGEAIVAPPATTAARRAARAHHPRRGCGDVSADERQLRPVPAARAAGQEGRAQAGPGARARWPSSMPGWRGRPKRPCAAETSWPAIPIRAPRRMLPRPSIEPAPTTWINCQAALDQRFAPLTELLIGAPASAPASA